MKGKFITFEGSEGSGKSTQAKLVEEYLGSKKMGVLYIREPGGVKISESVRRILLDVNNTKMADECEVLLYMAARSQLVKEVIVPALKKGQIVLCDRFLDSTIVYQGYGNGINMDMIKHIGEFATQGVAPDLTLLFDIDTEKGLSRAGDTKDRIELRSLAYHNRVREGYLKLAAENPKRIKLIRVDQCKKETFALVRQHIDKFLNI